MTIIDNYFHNFRLMRFKNDGSKRLRVALFIPLHSEIGFQDPTTSPLDINTRAADLRLKIIANMDTWNHFKGLVAKYPLKFARGCECGTTNYPYPITETVIPEMLGLKLNMGYKGQYPPWRGRLEVYGNQF